MTREELLQLSRVSAKALMNPSAQYSCGDKNLSGTAIVKTFEKELNALGATPTDFEENKAFIYKLLQEQLTEVVPAKVLATYGMFADIKHYGFGDKAVFKVSISEASKKRAKSFVSKVAEAGRYETFKLDGYSLEVPMSSIGGAARVEWNEMITGSISLSDYYNLVLEGIDEAIYREIAKALKSAVTSLSSKKTNFSSQTAFDEREMDRLLQVADVYGGKSTIYCTFEFAATMVPQENWKMSDSMKEQLWNNGAFTTYKSHQVIILPQSFEDETNTKKVIDPSLAYIIPTGSEKPVKIAFEGTAQVKSFDNRDWSTEIHTFQRLGVAAYLINPGFCVYENTSLSMDTITE